MTPRLSIRDLTAQIGVSHTTVSLALRNSPRITPAVRKQVQKAARQAGYHADPTVSNLMARLRMIRTTAVRETLGFITAWPTRNGWRDAPNHVRFFDGAAHRAREAGYVFEEFWMKEAGMTSRRMSRILRARGIRGLVLCSLPNVGGRLALEWKQFACVAKGLTVQHPPVHRVVSSHYEDMHLVLEQLARRKYQRVGLVLGEALSARVDRAWLASYLLHQNDVSKGDRVPPAHHLHAGRAKGLCPLVFDASPGCALVFRATGAGLAGRHGALGSGERGPGAPRLVAESGAAGWPGLRSGNAG